MTKTLTVFIGLCLCLITSSSISATESDLVTVKKTAIHSAKATVQTVFQLSNDGKFMAGLDHYASGDDAHYVTEGTVLNLDALRASYEQIGPAVEHLHNNILAWNTTYLSPEAVLFTLPVELTIKLKGVSEYTGQLVWTGVVQKRQGRWVITNSHESWFNAAEVASALTLPTP